MHKTEQSVNKPSEDLWLTEADRSRLVYQWRSLD